MRSATSLIGSPLRSARQRTNNRAPSSCRSGVRRRTGDSCAPPGDHSQLRWRPARCVHCRLHVPDSYLSDVSCAGRVGGKDQHPPTAATASNARARKVIIEASPPLLSSHTIARRLLFPIGPHVDVATTRAALGAHRLARKRRDLSVVREFRHVDQPRVPARPTVARQGDACCRASSDRRVVLHSITLSARARSVG